MTHHVGALLCTKHLEHSVAAPALFAQPFRRPTDTRKVAYLLGTGFSQRSGTFV